MISLILLGALGGVATGIFVAKCFAQRYAEILAILLAVIAALYVGPTIEGSSSEFLRETLVALVLIVLAVYGLRANLLVLATGYAAHGVWDLAHGLWVPHVLPSWYAPVCVGYDLAVAACIVYEYRRRAGLVSATS